MSNSESSQSASGYIIHASILYRCWRDGDMYSDYKRTINACFPFVPTFWLTLAALSHHEPYFSSVSARILATHYSLSSMEVPTHFPGWTNIPRRHGASWTLTTDVTMSLRSTNYCLFSVMSGLNQCNSSSR